MCKCWSQWLLIAVIFVFSLMTLLTSTGCGIKGPLYLPDDEKAKQAEMKKAEKTVKKEAEKTEEQAKEK